VTREIAQATFIILDSYGSTASTIAKAQGASNNVDCNAMTTTSTAQQSAFYAMLQGATTIK
jgi:hypothetical protein